MTSQCLLAGPSPLIGKGMTWRDFFCTALSKGKGK
uniref:Uncharacterized protein n=1 Tax=Anguilla anguilla TaxID=7936 RepID=A0A0E9P6C0_ANGAN